MRRTLLDNCKDCKYRYPFDYCKTTKCEDCKMYTSPKPVGLDENDKPCTEEFTYTTCKCLCDATDEEVRTGTCKYKELASRNDVGEGMPGSGPEEGGTK